MECSIEPRAMLDSVKNLLQTNTFQFHASGFDRQPLIQIANELGGPRMKLLYWKRLRDLGRIPHSKEQETVDALEGIKLFGASRVEIIMISHRWLRPSINGSEPHPDTDDNRKAKAINEFSKWRRQWVLETHGFLPEIYYWIDFSCIDQDQPAKAVPLLPVWVACCERFLRIETNDYSDRAWCRLEPLLSYVYSFAEHHISIDLDFKSRWPDKGQEKYLPVLNPNRALVTNSEDMALIRSLADLAIKTKPAREGQKKVLLGETKVKVFAL